MDAFVGIDLGTSGCRGIAIDRQNQVIAESSVNLPETRSERLGERRQNPSHWWRAVTAVLRSLGEKCRDWRIRSIAVDATSSTLLLCDEQGQALTPGLMYDDSSGQREVDRLRLIAPAESPVLNPSSSLAKLLYLAKTIEGTPFYALHQADWIMGRLAARFPLSDENNCLKLGYDPLARRWPDWFASLDLPSACLPRVLPCGSAVGRVDPELAQTLGLAPDTTIVTGTTDSNAAFLATGADQVGDAVSSLGSTLVLKILSERPVFAAEYGVYSHRLGERWLVSGASNCGTAVCRTFFTPAEIERMTGLLRPEQPTGLDYYPLPGPGERFPLNDSSLAPRLEPRPEDDIRFFQAILEGLTRIEREGYRLLQSLGAPRPTRVLSVGGGAVNEPWRRMREAALGVPVTRPRQQAAAYGAALLARQGAAAA